LHEFINMYVVDNLWFYYVLFAAYLWYRDVVGNTIKENCIVV